MVWINGQYSVIRQHKNTGCFKILIVDCHFWETGIEVKIENLFEIHTWTLTKNN